MPKKKKNEKPEVHPDLKGLDIKINEFGEIETDFDLNKLNEFLDENVDDKKFKDLDEIKRKSTDE